MKTRIYLDYAAATPVDAQVLEAMQPYFAQRFYNPSATYDAARAVKKDLEAARAKIAQTLGARPGEIVFTAGGTEANNLAIRGVLEKFPDGNLVVSAIEHESVLAPAKLYENKLVPVNEQGIVDVQTLVRLVDDKTVLVSVMYANNEVGTVQPIRDIAQAIAEIRRNRQAKGNDRPLYFHTDAAQAANYLDLHVARLGVDMMTLNGGKIYGPKASGVLYVDSHVQLNPQILGGGQERGMRSGTENVAAAVGFGVALELAQNLRHEEVARLSTLQRSFFDTLKGSLPEAVVNGSRTHRLPNNMHITIPGQDNERLLIQLDEAGIECAAGSACSASDVEPSHVLKAMGIGDVAAQASLRLTIGRGTDEAAVRAAVKQLAHFVESNR